MGAAAGATTQDAGETHADGTTSSAEAHDTEIHAGPKIIGHLSPPEESEAPTLVEPPPMEPGVRPSYHPPRISLPPPAIRTGHQSLHPSALASRGLLRGSTVIEALHSEEAARASAFGRGIAVLCLIGLGAQPFMKTPIWLRATLSVALVGLFSVAIWAFVRARSGATYSRRVFRVFASSCVLISPLIVYYCGVFSPAPLLLTLGISFFGLGDDDAFAIGGPAVVAVFYVLLAGLTVAGVVPEAGLFPSSDALPFARPFMLVLVPSVLVVTLWQARLSRHATLDAIERATAASRLAAQRQAQLDEAHQNLDRALRAGAGLEGRHSGNLAGRYRLAEVIGRGAMGEVYAASHVESGERAAVKLLSVTGRETPALVERFLREGEISLRLESPNVVRVLEVGALAEGAPFIVMELLEGRDLAHHLRQEKQLDLHRVVDLIAQVARGLEAAHDASIVHRDLKPQNLFLAIGIGAERGTWKILDFGVSKLSGSSGTLTQHAVVGTPGYMSPEQAQGLEANAQSDIFSLGAVAYRALTGRPPFSGSDTPQILFEIVYKTPTRPSEIVSSLPRDVDLVLAMAMAKRRDERFESASAFADALEMASRGRLTRELRDRARAIVAKYPWGRAVVDGEGRGKRR